MYQDIGMGLLIGVAGCLLTGQHFGLIIFGAIAAIIPDIDFVVYQCKRGWKKPDRYSYVHRDLLHHPILFLLSGVGIAYSVDPAFGAVWILCTMGHFIHDTYTAWGMRWGFPLWKSYWVLRSDSPRKVVASKAELRAIVSVYGDDNWLQTEYGTKNSALLLEKIIFYSGCAAALAYWAYN